MQTYILLLKGVNVGGKNIVPMKVLKALLLEKGMARVETYIQSGNVILLSPEMPESVLADVMQAGFGFVPEMFVFTQDEFVRLSANNPYQMCEGKSVHIFFGKNAGAVDLDKVNHYRSDTETCQLVDGVFFLHAPDGIGRSKLVANIERCLGTSTTARNLNTVNTLIDMAATLTITPPSLT